MPKPMIGLIGGPYMRSDGSRTYGLPADYSYALSIVGAIPAVIAPNVEADTLRDFYERCDGVLIAGGGDIDPAQYGLPNHPSIQGVDKFRDAAEKHFIQWALADDKPLLGICRGCQMLNVVLGGTLYRDINTEYPHLNHTEHNGWTKSDHSHDNLAHDVTVVPTSRLHTLVSAERLTVNSFHHQALRDIAAPLQVTATSTTDNIVEAVEIPDARFVVAVQWHPESLVDQQPMMLDLFKGFIAAIR